MFWKGRRNVRFRKFQLFRRSCFCPVYSNSNISCRKFVLWPQNTHFRIFLKTTFQLLKMSRKNYFLHLTSLTNNQMGMRLQDLGASGVRSKVWVLTIRVIEVNPEVDSVWDGLQRPGGAFFQIGLGCVMSHHQSPHRRALHIPVCCKLFTAE